MGKPMKQSPWVDLRLATMDLRRYTATKATLAHNEILRNPAITAALEQGLAHRNFDELRSLLVRMGGLPSPRPNWRLAWAFAGVVAAAGSRADPVVAELLAMNEQRAPPRSAQEFLPLVGVFCLASRALAASSMERNLDDLLATADDSRHLVREAIVLALVEIGGQRSEELVELLERWMRQYLPAAVALTALSTRQWLDHLGSAEPVIARMDEAFALIEGAARADRRSQGYRALVTVLSDAPAKILGRFSGPTLAWLESKVDTVDVELREALHAILDSARSRGQRSPNLEGVRAGLDASAPPRRDPKTYVGPTRQRGRRK
jgi:hypothetical protein